MTSYFLSIIVASMMEPKRKKSSFLLYTACSFNHHYILFTMPVFTSLMVWVCSTSTSLGAVSMLSEISVLIAINNWPLKDKMLLKKAKTVIFGVTPIILFEYLMKLSGDVNKWSCSLYTLGQDDKLQKG